MKNILITAGGTSEPVDSVRSITNSGTGRLGSLTAEEFAKLNSVGAVYYICSKTALKPAHDKIRIITVESVDDLKNAVESLLHSERIDVVVHSMAVSDYRVRSVSTIDRVEEALGGGVELEKALDETDLRKGGEKLSSKMGAPLILLEQTPKILPCFRKLAPNAVIIGFKLLSNVSRERLFEVAKKLMTDNGCDYVLANDSAEISGDSHIGYLLGKDGSTKRLETKQEIARSLAGVITEDNI